MSQVATSKPSHHTYFWVGLRQAVKMKNVFPPIWSLSFQVAEHRSGHCLLHRGEILAFLMGMLVFPPIWSLSFPVAVKGGGGRRRSCRRSAQALCQQIAGKGCPLPVSPPNG